MSPCQVSMIRGGGDAAQASSGVADSTKLLWACQACVRVAHANEKLESYQLRICWTLMGWSHSQSAFAGSLLLCLFAKAWEC
jgi:hypothetical protein